ncbi:MAG TPA: HAD family phosphatase [Patescibacteria group bacterium]|nr:HAD family phosphatase [Patescibacteria group bacterium]
MKAVIFDLDGTLINNEWIYDQAYCVVLKSLNISCDQLNHIPGIGLQENWERMVNDLGIKKTSAELAAQTRDAYLQNINKVKLRDGARELIFDLKRKHTLAILGTSTGKETATQVLQQIGAEKLFDFTVFGDEVENKKPAPDIFLKAMDKAGILPRETIVIEDSAAGVEAGKAAGAKVIAIKTDWYTRDQLFRADFIADDFAHILDLIKNEKTLDHSTG